MKITFVLPTVGLFPPSGGTRVVYEYANRLKTLGHEVKLVYPVFFPIIESGWRLRNLTDQLIFAYRNFRNGVKVTWFNLEVKLIRVLSLNPKYKVLVERYVPDADSIVATSWQTAYFVNSLGASKGKKFYFIQHYEIGDIWSQVAMWREVEKIESDPSRFCLAMHDVVPTDEKLRREKEAVDKTFSFPLNKITISSWLEELIKEKFGETVVSTIINGVNFETFSIDSAVRKREKMVLMPCRREKWKGTEDGLKAFAIVREKYPETEFHVYGATDINIPKWITQHGNVSDAQLREIYNSSSVFVFPSWVEGCGMPPMEAMACGCAVVATDSGGISDFIIPEKTCLISPPRNPEALAENIIRVIEDVDKLEKLAGAGNTYIKRFTWDNATAQLEKSLT